MQIFVTGGTFDKEYNYINGKLVFSDSHVQAMLKRGRCAMDVVVTTLMMKDSLEMKEVDRNLILQAIHASSDHQIVITHGTDTMVQTAEYLASKKVTGKTVVLTGAMIPYTFGTSSDGFFNLGAALAFAQVLPEGIFVAMNGRYYPWNKVQKNYTTGFFEYQ